MLIDIRDQTQMFQTPSSPRWFWPPVLIPRNGLFLFDLFRDDSAFVGTVQIATVGDLYLRWIGFKVRSSC